jgi:hypothetical protein
VARQAPVHPQGHTYQFDMKHRKAIAPAIAEKYGICPRTAYRWEKQLGRKIHDPRAIAEMLLRQRNPRPEVISKVHSLIQ